MHVLKLDHKFEIIWILRNGKADQIQQLSYSYDGFPVHEQIMLNDLFGSHDQPTLAATKTSFRQLTAI